MELGGASPVRASPPNRKVHLEVTQAAIQARATLQLAAPKCPLANKRLASEPKATLVWKEKEANSDA